MVGWDAELHNINQNALLGGEFLSLSMSNIIGFFILQSVWKKMERCVNLCHTTILKNKSEYKVL